MDTTGIISCSYGTSNLVVIDCTVRETPNLDKTTGARLGTFVRVEAECEVRASNAADFAAALLAVENDLRIDGRDFVLYGIGQTVLYTIPASGAVDSGPHCGFEMLRGESMFSEKIKLIVTTQQSGQGNSSTPTNIFHVKLATGPDDLQVVSWEGTLTGTATMAYFLATVLPAFQGQYNGAGGSGAGGWSVKSATDLANGAGTSQTLKYTMVATEFYGPLPTTGAATGVSGSISQHVETDEHYRKTTTYDFDILLAGESDPVAMVSQLRQTYCSASVVLREGYKIELLKENRASGSFTILASNDPALAPLMNLTQTARLQPQESIWEEKTYAGAAPILVQMPQRLPRVTFTGSAMAAGKFLNPAATFSGGNNILAQPELTLTDQNDLEKGTTWSFELYQTANGQAVDLTNFNTTPLGRSALDPAWFPGQKPPSPGASEDGGEPS